MAAPSALHFRFAARIARVQCDDSAFLDRFAENFLDCIDSGAAGDADAVVLDVHAGAPGRWIDARIPGHDAAADPGAFARLFPELNLVAIGGPADGPAFAHARAPHDAVILLRGERIAIDRTLPWQALLGHYFVHYVMKLQPALLFLHAATVGIGGRGVLLCGEKGAGKSTLSVALAGRGHAFLGDEVAAIDPRSRMLLPFRRRASLRTGPQSARVVDYLQRYPVERETLADGSVRSRVQVSTMFAAARAQPLPLAAAFFIGAHDAQPSARPIAFERCDLPHVSPLDATMSSASPGLRALTFLNLFQAIPCFGLRPGGTPDATADLIERAVETTWVTA